MQRRGSAAGERARNGNDSEAFLATGAATAATAVIGGAATDVDSAWYRGLDLPDWQPPGAVIGQVWTALLRADRRRDRAGLAACLGTQA